MNKHVNYTYVLIHILIGYAICSDKLNKLQPGDTDGDGIDEVNYDSVVKDLEALLDDKEDHVSKQITKGEDEIFDEDVDAFDDGHNEIVREIEKLIEEDDANEPSNTLEKDSANLSPYRSAFTFSSYRSPNTSVKVQSSGKPVITSQAQLVKQYQPPQLFTPILPAPRNFITPQVYQPVYLPQLNSNFSTNISRGPYRLQLLPRYLPPFIWTPRYFMPTIQTYRYQHSGKTKVIVKPSMPTEPSKSSDPSKPTTESTKELKPEIVPVEMGSDEESEKEEGAVGGAGGGDDEDKDEGMGRKRVEKLSTFFPDVKKCDSISFMKKNEMEKLVRMIWKDFYVAGCGSYITKYSFLSELEQVLCDDEIIYEHKPGKPYYRSVCYNNQLGSFVFESESELLLLRFTKNKWKANKFKNQCPFKLFRTGNGDGNYVELTHEDYCVEIGKGGSIKYRFCNSIRCTKVMFGDDLVWEKATDEESPLGLCSSYNEKIVFYFDGYNKIFGKKYKKYAILSSGKDTK